MFDLQKQNQNKVTVTGFKAKSVMKALGYKTPHRIFLEKQTLVYVYIFSMSHWMGIIIDIIIYSRTWSLSCLLRQYVNRMTHPV